MTGPGIWSPPAFRDVNDAWAIQIRHWLRCLASCPTTYKSCFASANGFNVFCGSFGGVVGFGCVLHDYLIPRHVLVQTTQKIRSMNIMYARHAHVYYIYVGTVPPLPPLPCLSLASRFALLIDLEQSLRSFSSGLLHQRLGGLPNIWQHRENLKSLELTLGSAAGAIKYGTYNKNESRWLCKRRLVD